MTTLHPSTSLDLPNIIAKYALKGTSATLADDTKTYTWKGFVSSMDAHLFYLAAMAGGDGLGSERHTQHHVIFNGGGKQYSWYVKQNYVPKGGKFYVTFELSDYTIPAQTERIVKQLTKRFEDANRWLELVLKSPWENKAIVQKDAIENVYYAAQCLAD